MKRYTAVLTAALAVCTTAIAQDTPGQTYAASMQGASNYAAANGLPAAISTFIRVPDRQTTALLVFRSGAAERRVVKLADLGLTVADVFGPKTDPDKVQRHMSDRAAIAFGDPKAGGIWDGHVSADGIGVIVIKPQFLEYRCINEGDLAPTPDVAAEIFKSFATYRNDATWAFHIPLGQRLNGKRAMWLVKRTAYARFVYP